jgi:uncharacterized LabA/DUF88 family protein
MSEKSFCRIGVFYDGSYFNFAQRHFYHTRSLGWLDLRAFHSLIENYLQTREPGYDSYRIVYASWFQGLFHTSQSSDAQLRFERHLHHDLMHAGVDPKYLPMAQSGQGEKGVDVALAVDALQVGLEGKIDIAVLVTGDGDLVPLVRALMKHGIRVMAAYFQYEDRDHNSFINERLLAVCNYELNVNNLEMDKNFRAVFRSLFRKSESNTSAS